MAPVRQKATATPVWLSALGMPHQEPEWLEEKGADNIGSVTQKVQVCSLLYQPGPQAWSNIIFQAPCWGIRNVLIHVNTLCGIGLRDCESLDLFEHIEPTMRRRNDCPYTNPEQEELDRIIALRRWVPGVGPLVQKTDWHCI